MSSTVNVLQEQLRTVRMAETAGELPILLRQRSNHHGRI